MTKKIDTFSSPMTNALFTTDDDTRRKTDTVAQQRNYHVLDVREAKNIAYLWLQSAQLENAIDFGLPEIDDRYHVWRVPLLQKATRERIGEVVIDAHTSLVLADKSSAQSSLEARLLGRRFVLIEQEANYLSIICDRAKDWLGPDASAIFTINCSPIQVNDRLM